MFQPQSHYVSTAKRLAAWETKRPPRLDLPPRSGPVEAGSVAPSTGAGGSFGVHVKQKASLESEAFVVNRSGEKRLAPLPNRQTLLRKGCWSFDQIFAFEKLADGWVMRGDRFRQICFIKTLINSFF